MDSIKIGILSKNYAAQRLFLNKISGAKYKDIYCCPIKI